MKTISDPYPIPVWTRPVRGSVALPGSKSLTNRSLLLAAMAEGETLLRGALFSRDTRLLIDALRELGFPIEANETEQTIRITGNRGKLPRAKGRIHVGNAGTVARFLPALIALQEDSDVWLDGDPEMLERPMAGLFSALSRLGADVEFAGKPGHYPAHIRGRGLRGGVWEVDARESSQMLSALMMVAPMVGEPVEIRSPGVRRAFVDMTTGLLRQFGVSVDEGEPDTFRIEPVSKLSAPEASFTVEPDLTASSYFLLLPDVVGGSLLLEGFPRESLQGDIRFLEVVGELGGLVEPNQEGMKIRYNSLPSAPLSFDFRLFSDTFLGLAAISPLLRCELEIRGIGHTRRQETDRVAGMERELQRIGVKVRATGDALFMDTRDWQPPEPKSLPVVMETYRDHRFAMSFALLGSANLHSGKSWLSVSDPLCCGKTFPGFFEVLDTLHKKSHD